MSDKKKMLIATLWVSSAFGLSQVIRLASNLITTRFLEPEMFGVMAVVYSLIIGVEMFSDIGIWDYVVRTKDPTDKKMLNTIWTIQVIRGWVVFLCISILSILIYILQIKNSNYISGVYLNEQLPFLILITGSTAVVSGYKTLASPLLSRTMNYSKLELVDIPCQILGVSTMLVWAWISPNIWALASAAIVTAILRTLSSYYYFSFRHKLEINKAVVKDLFNFSKWIVLSTALTYFVLQGDKLFLGAKLSEESLGIYSIAFMLSTTIISVLNMIARKVVFPSMASIQSDNVSAFKNRYYKVRLVIDGPLFFGVGALFAFAPTLITFMYDERYSDAGWMLQILLLSVVGSVLTSIAVECLKALSETKVNMWVMFTRLIGLIILLPLLFEFYGLSGAIWAISINVWLGIPIIFFTLAKYKVLSVTREFAMLLMLPVGYYLANFVLANINAYS